MRSDEQGICVIFDWKIIKHYKNKNIGIHTRYCCGQRPGQPAKYLHYLNKHSIGFHPDTEASIIRPEAPRAMNHPAKWGGMSQSYNTIRKSHRKEPYVVFHLNQLQSPMQDHPSGYYYIFQESYVLFFIHCLTFVYFKGNGKKVIRNFVVLTIIIIYLF